MTDVLIRTQGRAGRITLDRPAVLNALTWDMCLAIEAALDAWRGDEAVDLVLIDGAGDRAFCAGGDIALMYDSTLRGDLETGRRFWRDEYRLNAKLFGYPKPVVSFLQGYTMGGGVGIGCHVRHRIVGETSKVAMPECAIGLVPDVGGTLWLARAPGRIGEYLAVTGDRMDAGDALFAGFADHFVPESQWPALKSALCAAGSVAPITAQAHPAPPSRLAGWQADIDRAFAGDSFGDICRGLDGMAAPAADLARAAVARNSPLAMWVAVENLRKVRAKDDIRFALMTEYRFTYRSAEGSDFIEGIRAMIIDKDKAPRWKHRTCDSVTAAEVAAMTAPLDAAELSFDKE